MSQLALPEAFAEVDGMSMRAQADFVRSTRWQLILLVVAGAAGIFTIRAGRLDVAALIGGVAFVGAGLLRLRLIRGKLHQIWYEGRAAAESLKTLSWRYAVGGDPFPLENHGADAAFEEQVREVLAELATMEDLPRSVSPTRSMRRLRDSSSDERRGSYRQLRIDDQIDWYTGKARWNQRRSRFWGWTILVLQFTGATGAFLKGFGLVDFDLFGFAAAIVGSAAAWLESRQHSNLASAYRVAAHELREIASLVGSVPENEWATFVSEAEGAMSREHTTWAAASRQRRPADLL